MQQSKKDDNQDQDDSQQQKLRVFSPGDIVGLYQSDRHQSRAEKTSSDGIVYKVTNDELVIAFNDAIIEEAVSLPSPNQSEPNPSHFFDTPIGRFEAAIIGGATCQ